MTYKHILVTTDFSQEARRAYKPAIEMARDMGARLTLFHVVPQYMAIPHGAPLAPMQPNPDAFASKRQAEDTIVKEATQFPKELQIDVDVELGEQVQATVSDYCERSGVDLIVISTHGRSGIRRLIMGSSAELILRHSRVPVLCIPPAQ